ncbi:hypothetical protein [Nocardia vinacea]|uniref:hypothetical protein n=1 Tax=Nocardia vinacea TaxID=96468 RepID=UPI0005936B8D|nr:hypothetical protein [Nocardia vinacea]
MRGDPAGEDHRITQISGTNVAVGAHSRQINHFWRDRRTRLLITVGIAVTLLTGAGVVYALQPNTPHEDLQLAALEVAKPSKIDADIYDASIFQKHDQVDATAIDITLKNHGQDTALITTAHIDVLYGQQMENCPHQGDSITANAQYSVFLPATVSGPPFRVDRDMRFEVKPVSADRFSITVGPQHESLSTLTPSIYVLHISLTHDNDSKPLDIGNVALVVRPGEGAKTVDKNFWYDMPCVKRNADRVNKLYEFNAVRADELDYMRNQYASIQGR